MCECVRACVCVFISLQSSTHTSFFFISTLGISCQVSNQILRDLKAQIQFRYTSSAYQVDLSAVASD